MTGNDANAAITLVGLFFERCKEYYFFYLGNFPRKNLPSFYLTGNNIQCIIFINI